MEEEKKVTLQPEAAEAFEALITGEFKDLYDARVEAAVASQKREKGELAKKLEELKRFAGTQAVYGALLAEARDMEGLYPGFDIAQELASPRFRQMLDLGLDMKTAYEAVHHDTLVEEAMAYALAKGGTPPGASHHPPHDEGGGIPRPLENGQRSASAALTTTDVRHMSRADRREIIRRVTSGETIRL